MEINEETKKELTEAREEIKKGKHYSFKSAKKRVEMIILSD